MERNDWLAWRRKGIGAMLALARRAHKDKGEVRQYRCPFCRGWHLTSQHERTT